MNQYDRIFLLVKEAKVTLARPKRVGPFRKLLTWAKGHDLSRVEVLGKMSQEDLEKAYLRFKTTAGGGQA